MIIETFKRYETKYYLTETQYRALTGRIAPYTAPDPYCVDGKSYPLYNEYFDTPDHRILLNSLAKPYYKEKLRVRSYDPDPAEDGTVFFELKKKIGGIVSKRRASLKRAELTAFLETGKMPEEKDGEKGYVKTQVMREIARFLSVNEEAAPVYYVAYDRVALFARDDRNFRITFDRNIRAKKKDGFSLSDDPDCISLLPEGMWLMETKIASALPLWLTSALSELGIRQTSFSKVGRAFETFQTGVPSGEKILKSLSGLPAYRQ